MIRRALPLVALIACGTDISTDVVAPDPVPPQAYVAKVKNILVGLPPTDAEIAAVVADPAALGGLVDQWMLLPEYQQKMLVYFELAFQQTQISNVDFVDMVPPRGLGNGKAVPQLVQNIRESFARTALQLVAEGRPFTDAFTTHRYMMTPALMELYAFLDTRRIDDDGAVSDAFAVQNKGLKITMETSLGPIPLADSVNPASPNFMHWYSPDLPTVKYLDASCVAQDPITFAATALQVHLLLYGEIPIHPGPSGSCNPGAATAKSVQLAATDFTDWRMVTLRPPAAGEARSAFFDLPALRAASELVIGTPRVGFFTTPAFFANWSTNASNQMRVTVNQALIVATGAAIDGTDATKPSATPGLDAAHAAPGSTCFTCHQLLDPTRSILSSTYSWFYYPQTDVALTAQPGIFAFQGVIAPMRTVDDFAKILAVHPLVPAGWAQKLCYYVNSAPCSPDDAEFARITKAFASGYSWNALVKDVVTSPLTTQSAVIAVSRRDHLCAALNNRLGFVDICALDVTMRRGQAIATIAKIIAGMPSDGYGRGSTAPVLPNDPTLFYRAGLENICTEVATMVVDAKADPMQPGAKHWSSSQPDQAIGDFVSTLLALAPSDARAPQAQQILHDHFTAALATGASSTDALRSTFVTACLSPSFIGIGM